MRDFSHRSVDAYLANLDTLAAQMTPMQTLGVVAHSLRAVDPDTVARLHRESLARGLPFHMHLEEQQAEVDACLQAHGRRPMRVLLDAVDSCENITAVHCTLTAPNDMAEFIARGGTVCACPLTEGALGDGVADFSAFRGRVCLGSDCNARVDLVEEMRWLEYAQRQQHTRRGVCNAAGPVHETDLARRLFEHATVHGARALGLRAGAIAPGHAADFALLDLASQALCPAPPGGDADLLAALVFGGSAACVAATCVDGHWHGVLPTPLTNSAANSVDAVEAAPTVAPAGADESFAGLAQVTDVCDLAAALIDVSSLSGHEQPMARALAAWLRARGWAVQLQPVAAQQGVPGGQMRHNVYARPAGAVGAPCPRLLFNSHIDTVPPHIPCRRDAERLYGRGACDTKSLLAAQMTALLRLEARGYSKDIGLLYVVSEETDHSGMMAANALGLQPKYLVVAEPTESRLVRFQKGMLKIKLIKHGVACHSAYPELGQSAIDPLVAVLFDLQQVRVSMPPRVQVFTAEWL